MVGYCAFAEAMSPALIAATNASVAGTSASVWLLT